VSECLNAVAQINNALFVAKVLGSTRIEFSAPPPFFVGDNIAGIDIVLQWSPIESVGSGLEGSFCYLQGLGLEPSPYQARFVSTFVRSMVAPELRAPNPKLLYTDLVLHFRAGDIFVGESRRWYGPPPLACHLKTVERESPSKVWLVFEDRLNPCIHATEDALHVRNVDFES
jgi:hypothetical protein